MIETELKYLLDKDAFQRIYRYLRAQKIKPYWVRQTNYYFDTNSLLLQQQRLNIRIRRIGTEVELTCKIPMDTSHGNNLLRSYEFNWPLDAQNMERFLQEGISPQFLLTLKDQPFDKHRIVLEELKCWGHLRTTRFFFPVINDHEPLLLDISSYLGIIDYELEWEMVQPLAGCEFIKDLFETNGITAAHMQSKRKRFFERLQTANPGDTKFVSS